MNMTVLRPVGACLLAALLLGAGGPVDPPAGEETPQARTTTTKALPRALRGIRLPTPECEAGQQWDAQSRSCVEIARDADRDGAIAIELGGDDCDDQDPTRFPGNVEVCDADGHDEDCNFETGGERDADRDGHVDSQCFNWGPPRGR